MSAKRVAIAAYFGPSAAMFILAQVDTELRTEIIAVAASHPCWEVPRIDDA